MGYSQINNQCFPFRAAFRRNYFSFHVTAGVFEHFQHSQLEKWRLQLAENFLQRRPGPGCASPSAATATQEMLLSYTSLFLHFSDFFFSFFFCCCCCCHVLSEHTLKAKAQMREAWTFQLLRSQVERRAAPFTSSIRCRKPIWGRDAKDQQHDGT